MVQGNDFSNACIPQLRYILNICNGSDAAPAEAPSTPAAHSPSEDPEAGVSYGLAPAAAPSTSPTLLGPVGPEEDVEDVRPGGYSLSPSTR